MDYKLLVVDDEPIVRRGIRELVDLNRLGISECKEASDGLEALQILETFQPDIVLLDINMPHMDGLSFAWQLKKTLATARIILITGYDYFEYAREALRLGVDDYILKPISKNEIEQILKNTIEKLKEHHKYEEIQKSVSHLSGLSDEEVAGANEYIAKLVRVMESHYQDATFDLKALSTLMNLSQGYISRLFKTHLHKTFPEYLNDLRLERARVLIIGTNMKIYEITEKCGYSDATYFSNSFKKKYGCPPIKYRETLN